MSAHTILTNGANVINTVLSITQLQLRMQVNTH